MPAEAVWHALSDNEAREQWFSAGTAFDVREKSYEFRVGGQAMEDGQWHGGPRSRFQSTYTDIVDQQRIVFTYVRAGREPEQRPWPALLAAAGAFGRT